ncbi:Actin-related 7 [Micractinium conductrix]|uniref:Actin-related 7 n=1 Tax=Micractinium conductrix TaxID=554055 RepID=A0A2P6VEK0_9CHLO|nr:Actin-related 7 [Micractinium conductrix]|eukprot:PSC72499.1 Actin-related 7 [Micractinium conductrix]
MDVVVLDLGSRYLRAGKADPWPNEKEPWVVTAAEATVRDHTAALPPATLAGQDAGGGGAAAAAAATGRLVHPIQQGSIVDWDVLEACVDHVLYDRIGWQRGKEGGLMLAEPNFISRDERERLCQLMFEVFNLSGYHAADQAVLSLYAVGRLNGTVIDIGYSKTDIVPVLDGLAQPSTAQRLPYGMHQLSQRLAEQLAARGIHLGSSSCGGGGGSSCGGGLQPFAASVALEGLTHSIVRVAGSSEDAAAAAAAAAAEPTTHTLPDGQTITIEREGVQLGEALMDGGQLGLDVSPLPQAVCTAATAQGDKDTRKTWLEGLLLCGSGSSVPGLGARLLRELRALSPPQLAPALCAVPQYMPEGTLRHAAWMGGAVLARVVYSQGSFISKADYDELGPAAVLRKCA